MSSPGGARRLPASWKSSPSPAASARTSAKRGRTRSRQAQRGRSAMSDRRTPPNGPSFWAPYTPTAEAPWDLRRVVHLHRRAGFAATWRQVQRDLKDGPGASIDRLLAGEAACPGLPDGFEETARALADSAVASGDPGRLKAWWVYQMLFSPD